MKIFGWVCLGILIFFGLIALSIFSFAANWFGSAATVVQQQIDPAVLQQKYEWFKDASAQLDKKQADIQVYESRLQHQKCDAATDRVKEEQCMVWEQETAGVIASYNSLAADYNSEMSKWNWRFTNVGQLPQGASTPLPREYKPYEIQ